MIMLKLIKESLIFAFTSITANKLRTFLSLLGITIGIFAIISVFTVIDSLEKSIQNSINSLGKNVVYIQKWHWGPPEGETEYPWWKYMKRPDPTLKESKQLRKRSTRVEAVCFINGTNANVNYRNTRVDNIIVMGTSEGYDDIWNFDISMGRYFSNFDLANGKNFAVIGANIAENLFGGIPPVGRDIKINGYKVQVIGVFKKEGESIIFDNSKDNQVFVPINFAQNLFNIKKPGGAIIAKPYEYMSIDETKQELKRVMRSIRKLKPMAEDDFALNNSDFVAKNFKQVFGIIDLAGMFIGGLSILVGGFGIANIMFVSVKERTRIIGIQKSLGAKRYFILLQFLYEAVVLCVIGGGIGLLLIFFGTMAANSVIDMDFSLSVGNVLKGIFISVMVGIISGFAPALSASKLDPIKAMNAV